MIPVVSFVGQSGVGKTTFIEKVVRELKARGIRVVVVKHHAHTSSVDAPGKDSWRYAEAGADAVIVSSPVEIAQFQRVPHELSLAEIATCIQGVDIILTEGFKREAAPKILISRAAHGTDDAVPAGDLIAIVADHSISLGVPQFGLDDAVGLAALLVAHFEIKAGE